MSPPGPNPLTPLIDSLRRALQDRYTIERALGAAGAARAAAQTRALAPDGLEAALATGYHEAFVRGDPARAVEAYRAGLAAAPDNAVLLMNLGRAERALGRWDAALEHFERAYAADPRSGLTAWALASSGKFHSRREISQFFARAEDELRTIPSVVAVGSAEAVLIAADSVVEDLIVAGLEEAILTAEDLAAVDSIEMNSAAELIATRSVVANSIVVNSVRVI